MNTYNLSPAIAEQLDTATISVTEEGDVILAPFAGGALAVARIVGQDIEWLGDPSREFKYLVSAALVPYALDQADWNEIHELWALSTGDIWLWPDGSIVHLESGSSPSSDWGGIARIKCAGPGQIDSDYYAAGWTEFDEESREYLVKETGERLSFEEMIIGSIHEGEWIDFYDDLREEFIESANNMI